MVEKIKYLIKKFGLFQGIQMLRGINRFREIVAEYPELTYLLDELKGSCSVSYFSSASHPDAYFDFYILDYDIMDNDFVELIVDMVVDFKNLSGGEISQLKQWFAAVADDHGFEIYDVENLPSHQNLFIKSFNGKPFSWSGFHLHPDDDISDEEAFELLDKTGLWEGMIREENSLRDTIKTILNEESDEKEKSNESLNQKVRYAVENLGFVRAYEMFKGNKEILYNAYKDNPLSFLNQYNDLTPVKKGEVMFYVDKNDDVLFAYFKDDGRHIVNVDNDRMWEFFGEVLGYDWDDIQSLFKVWLSEVYGLENTRPLRAYQITNYPRI